MAIQVVDTGPVPLGSDRGCLEGMDEDALTVLPSDLSLFNFYHDNFPPHIFFPILSTFLTMTRLISESVQ